MSCPPREQRSVCKYRSSPATGCLAVSKYTTLQSYCQLNRAPMRLSVTDSEFEASSGPQATPSDLYVRTSRLTTSDRRPSSHQTPHPSLHEMTTSCLRGTNGTGLAMTPRSLHQRKSARTSAFSDTNLGLRPNRRFQITVL